MTDSTDSVLSANTSVLFHDRCARLTGLVVQPPLQGETPWGRASLYWGSFESEPIPSWWIGSKGRPISSILIVLIKDVNGGDGLRSNQLL